ncbi:peptidoglycan-binding protein [Streptomyces sp. NPDC090442]|uniref:peptidoglycan-binding protein n=1 Tax=Streptomyces sp. NPDC090442 TaxID=3365962 RepID=UPI00382C2065
MSVGSALSEARKWADQGYVGGLSPSGKRYDTPFGRWYPMNHQPYCDMFVSYCAAVAGEGAAVGKFAYCPSHVQWFKSRGQWLGRNASVRPGDVVFFSWDGGPTADHVGFVIADSSSGNVRTIEGNTVAGDGPNQGSGGAVCYKTRPRSVILGFGRPSYGAGGSSSGGAVVIDGKPYGPGSKGDHITVMGRALVRASCSRYKEGPGPNWTSADTESMRAYQIKIGDHGSADGVPGPKQLAKLLREHGDPVKPQTAKYRIKTGQTLTAIAALFGTTVVGLLALNPQIKNPDRINEGQEITVPAKPPNARETPSKTPGGSRVPEKPKKPSKAPYRAFPGASRFGVGQRGDHITLLGERLVAHGFGRHYRVGPDPVWRKVDRLNVRDFQIAQGWDGTESDGLPGPHTWALLMENPKTPRGR